MNDGPWQTGRPVSARMERGSYVGVFAAAVRDDRGDVEGHAATDFMNFTTRSRVVERHSRPWRSS